MYIFEFSLFSFFRVCADCLLIFVQLFALFLYRMGMGTDFYYYIYSFLSFLFCFVDLCSLKTTHSTNSRCTPTVKSEPKWIRQKTEKNQQQTGNPSTMKIGNVCVRFLLVSCGFVYYNFCWLCLSRYPTLNLIYFIFLLLSIFAYTLQFLYDWFYLYHMISHGVRFESGPSFDSRLQKNNIYVYLIRWDSIEYNNITVHTKKHNLDTRI